MGVLMEGYALMTSEMDGLTGSPLFYFMILRQNVIFLVWYLFCKDIGVKQIRKEYKKGA